MNRRNVRQEMVNGAISFLAEKGVQEYKKRKPPILKMPADPAQSKTTEKSFIHITTLLSIAQIT